jgi:kumamolisin
MRFSRKLVVSTFSVLLIAILSLSAAGGSITSVFLAGASGGSGTSLSTIAGSVLPITNGTVSAGKVDSNTPVSFTVLLPLRNETGLKEYLKSIYDKNSTNFLHYMTPQQIQAQFAPSQSDYEAIVSYLTSSGLTVTYTSSDRLMVGAQGTVSSVSTALHTQFGLFKGSSSTFFVNTQEVSLPSSLNVAAVFGLTNYSIVSPDYAGALKLGSATNRTDIDTGSAGGIYYPQQVQEAYGASAVYSGGNIGSGTTVAIVDAFSAENAVIDLYSFDQWNYLPDPTVNVYYPTGTPAPYSGGNTGWDMETTLDLQQAHSLAPGASLALVLSVDNYDSLYQAVDWIVAQGPSFAKVISMSWGAPEPLMTPTLLESFDEIFMFAAMEGITPIASAGDDGGANGLGILNVQYPASDPFVLSVGGTSAFFDRVATVDYSGNPPCSTGGGRVFESTWSWNVFRGWATGGGLSWWFGPNEWEYFVTGYDYRGVPDVAAVADPETGVFLVYYGDLWDIGGTSVGAPEWAGMVALFDTALSNAHLAPAGMISQAFYYTALAGDYGSDWYDVTVGNNQGDFAWWSSPDQPVGPSAGTGYDLVTGLGTPNLASLIPDVLGNWYSYPTITVTPANVFANGTWTVFNINGFAFTPSGSVTIYYWDSQGNYDSYWGTTAGTDGTFVFPVSINVHPGDTFYFYAYDYGSTDYSNEVTLEDSGQLFLNTTIAHEGSHVLLQGIGYFPGEEVYIYPDYTYSYFGVTANSTGGFSLVLTIPALPPSSSEIFAWGDSSGILGMTSLYVYPFISLSPSTGFPSTSFTVSGWSFNPGEVDLYMNGSYQTYLYTDGNGDFTTSLYVPSSPSGVVYVVTAYDELNYNATALFTVPIFNGVIAQALTSTPHWLPIPSGGSQQFSTNSTGGTVRTLKVYLSGTGIAKVSLGTSVFDTSLFNTTISTSGAGWYTITLPTPITLNVTSTYFLSVKPTSGSCSWGYASTWTSKVNVGPMYYYVGSTLYTSSGTSYIFVVT